MSVRQVGLRDTARHALAPTQPSIAGFFVTVPLLVSVAALVWAFRLIDGVMAPLYSRWLGRDVPGLGLVTTLAIVFGVGVLATNVFDQRATQRSGMYRCPEATVMTNGARRRLDSGARRLIVCRASERD